MMELLKYGNFYQEGATKEQMDEEISNAENREEMLAFLEESAYEWVISGFNMPNPLGLSLTEKVAFFNAKQRKRQEDQKHLALAFFGISLENSEKDAEDEDLQATARRYSGE